jgi:hypothetical protein
MQTQQNELNVVLPLMLKCLDILEQQHAQNFVFKYLSRNSVNYSDNYQDIQLIRDEKAATEFLAPELRDKQKQAVDFRSDLYAFGIVFFDYLTNKLPVLTPSGVANFDFTKHPYIPLSVTFIIQKLCYIYPTDRYQSHQGLRDDLKRCLFELESTSTISCFFPGLTDKPKELNFSHYLYGRELELQQISEIIKVSLRTHKSMLLVSGYSGVGKTSLIEHAISKLNHKATFIIQGKFDQTLNQPYHALILALKALNSDISQKHDEERLLWRQKLNQAVFPNGQVLINLIPELELLLGPQPPIVDLDTEQTKNRLNTVFLQFFNAFVEKNSSMIIFLDDLQWADDVSLKVMQVLLEQINQNFLFIGAYRDNECSKDHSLYALINTLDQVKTAQIKLSSLSQKQTTQQISLTLHEIPLDGLSSAALTEQLQDLFKTNSKQISLLAELIYSKTHGNPFFTKQLMTSLKDQGFIQYDASLKTWTWNLTRIQEQNITDNVVDFMIQQFNCLPQSTQEVLVYAACLGHKFSLKELSVILKKDQIQVELSLWIAVNRGLIALIETDQNEKYYKFLHDRIQQAAYESLSETAIQTCHLNIALAFDTNNQNPTQKYLLKVVDHFNLALPVINTDLLNRVLNLNYEAILVAKKSAAFSLAYSYVMKSLELAAQLKIDENFHINIQNEWAHCAYLSNRYDESERCYHDLLKMNLNPSAKIDCYCRLSVLYMHTGRPDKAILLLRPSLELIKIKIPKKIRPFHTKLLYFRYRHRFWKMAKYPALPMNDSMDKLTKYLHKIHTYFSSPTYMMDKNLHIYLRLICVFFDMRYKDEIIYISFISHFIGHENNLKYAKKLYALCKDTLHPRNHPDSKDFYLMGGYITPYFYPLKEALLDLEASAKRSKNYGEITFESFSLAILLTYQFISGQNLSEFLNYCEEKSHILEKNKELTALSASRAFPLIATRLIDGLPISQDYIEQIVSTLNKVPFQIGLFIFYLSLAQYYLIYDNIKLAKQYIDKVSQVPNGSLGTLHDDEFRFYKTLIAFIDVQNGTRLERIKTYMQNRKDMAWLKQLSDLNPANFRHLHQFLLAEKSCLFQSKSQVSYYYDRAIQAAIENSFNQYAAIAAERASKYCLKNNDVAKSQLYLKTAIEYYQKWGAEAKVLQCKNKLIGD